MKPESVFIPMVLIMMGMMIANHSPESASVNHLYEFNSANIASYSSHKNVYGEFDGFMIRTLNTCKDPFNQDTEIMGQLQCDKTILAFEMTENGVIESQSMGGLLMKRDSVGQYLLQSDEYYLQECVMMVTVKGNRRCD